MKLESLKPRWFYLTVAAISFVGAPLLMLGVIPSWLLPLLLLTQFSLLFFAAFLAGRWGPEVGNRS